MWVGVSCALNRKCQDQNRDVVRSIPTLDSVERPPKCQNLFTAFLPRPGTCFTHSEYVNNDGVESAIRKSLTKWMNKQENGESYIMKNFMACLLKQRVVNNEDNLPQSVCESCSQRLGSFDCYAEQCHRVQTMYEALVGQSDSKVGIIREEFLQEVSGANSASTEENEVEDIKKDIEMLAIDVDPFIPSDSSAPSTKKHGGIRRKRPAKSRSTCRPRRAKKAAILRTRNEQNKDHDGERRSF
ncbi:unnamed protein product [Timema podura]|uniref:ZAD domain-containing protein n=1 Tax=Timema podura TaxID=61482 RepID=A0ABN7NSK5_TIMPD|nr:unnamed protein product [Timema podura]